jgi:hypothetical protein
MAGIPEISGPQEREREMWKTTPRGNVLTTGMSTVPSGEPSFPRDESELQPSARVFEEMRERPQLCVRGGLTKGEGTLREDRPVVDGSWRHAGAEELPCELVREWRFLGSGVPVKQLRSRRKARRARSVPGTQPDPRFRHQMLGKTPLSKKAHEKSLTSIEQGLMAGPNCQAGRGKDGAPQLGFLASLGAFGS